MKTTNRSITKALTALIVTASLSACGSNGVTASSGQALTTSSTSTSTQTAANTNFTPTYGPIMMSTFGTANVNQTATPAISTDTTLALKVVAQPGTSINISSLGSAYTNMFGTYSNYVAQYNCVRFQVSLQVQTSTNVWTTAQTFITPYLSVPGTQGCQNLPSGADIETSVVYPSSTFANYLTAGHGQLRFTVAGYDSDHDCQYGYDYSHCPTYSVYQTHVVNANLSFQTD